MSAFILDQFLPYQLAVAASRTSREFEDLYRDRFGITVAEWRVVAHLSQEDEVSIREIFERVEMDKSRVSRAAARLEDAGYISKDENPEDRRLVTLRLTAKGHEMIDEIAPLAARFEAALADRLGQDAEAFRAGIETLLNKKK